MVQERGGVGIPVQVDHTAPAEVAALFEQVQADQLGWLVAGFVVSIPEL
jgi:hypothetical protein